MMLRETTDHGRASFRAIAMIDIWPYDIFVGRSSIFKGSPPMTRAQGALSGNGVVGGVVFLCPS